MKKVVITGAAGFAGYSTTIELLNRGYEVYAVLRPGSVHNDRLFRCNTHLHCIELDCSEFKNIAHHIDCKCDYFYHLAWFGGRDDFHAQLFNIEHTLKALESASELCCDRFIGIGSQAEYGIYDGIITEDILPKPINSYGAAKLSSLYLSQRRAEQLGIEWIWGRVFSLYGDYEPEGRLFPDLIRALKDNMPLQLSSCEQCWDYLHVKDGAAAIASLGDEGHSGEIYNIASGKYKPLKEFVEEAKYILKSSSYLEYGEKADPFISLKPDISKILLHTGWKPSISFEEGVLNFAK